MSKLDDLIEKLCPDGVEYKELGEILNYEQPTKYIVKSTEYRDEYEIPVLTAGKTFILGYTNEKNGLYEANKNNPVIIFDDFTTSFYWIDFVFKIKSSAIKILKHIENSGVNFKYVYYCMRNIRYENDDHRRQWIEKYSKFKIPIPPIEIQEEIVRILDSFTELEKNLEKELEKRKKQYEFYRDSLLTFGDDVEKIKLSEIATIKARIGWQGLTRDEYLTNGNYHLITGVNFVNGEVDFSKCYFISEDRYVQDINIQVKEKDILVTKDGTLGKVAYIKNLNKPATLNSGIFVVRIKDEEKVVSRYLYHYLKSPMLMNFAKSKLTGGTIKHLNQSVIVEFPIFLPPLSEQERIVSILDKFDALCNDISLGLPAEIEKRKKQYEHYREKLLNFKNISENN